jgi:hypothetical protein
LIVGSTFGDRPVAVNYVSRQLITKHQTKRSIRLRLPAAEVEQLVTSRVRQWLLDPGCMHRI